MLSQNRTNEATPLGEIVPQPRKFATIADIDGWRTAEETLSCSASELSRVVAHRGHVRVFSIPKKNGARRQIQAPTEIAKEIQRLTLLYLYSVQKEQKLLSVAAVGFRPKKATKLSAVRAGKILAKQCGGWVFTQDLQDAFPTVSEPEVREILRKAGLSGIALHLATRATTYQGQLLVGSRVSPMLLNIRLKEFDEEALNYAQQLGGTFTRYADDLTLTIPLRDKQGHWITKARARGIQRWLLAAIRRAGFTPHRSKRSLRQIKRNGSATEIVGVQVRREGNRIRLLPRASHARKARMAQWVLRKYDARNERSLGFLAWTSDITANIRRGPPLRV